MNRFNTGNPLSSLAEEDFYDNSMALDEAMNSTDPTWRDRFGVEKPTIDAALKSAGFMPAGFDFVTGGTLQPGDRNKAVYNPAPNGDNNWYRWNGVFPKEIAVNSRPNPKDENNWVPVELKNRMLRATTNEVANGLASLETYVSVVDRNDTLFKIIPGSVTNPGIEIPAGSGKKAQIVDLENIDIRSLTNNVVEEVLSDSFNGNPLELIPGFQFDRKGLYLQKNGSQYTFTINPVEYIGSGNKKYYVRAGAPTGKDGLTMRTPINFIELKTIYEGLTTKPNSMYIYLLDKVYGKDGYLATFSDFTVSTRLFVKSLREGGSWLTNSVPYTWETINNVSITNPLTDSLDSITDVFNIFDVDNNGIPHYYPEYPAGSSFSGVIRGWSKDPATNKISVKVPVFYTGVVMSGIVISRNNYSSYDPGANNFCLYENINWATARGAQLKTNSGYTQVFNKCKFVFGRNDGLAVVATAGGKTVLNECIAANNGKDGFNYHASGVDTAIKLLAIEINCQAYNSGKYKFATGNTTQHSNNGSTAHDGYSIYRFGGHYFDCEGPVLADVDGCLSHNFDVKVGSPLPTTTGGKTAFSGYDGTNLPYAPKSVKFISCDFYGKYNFSVDLSGTSELKIQNTKLNKIKISGTIKLAEVKNAN